MTSVFWPHAKVVWDRLLELDPRTSGFQRSAVLVGDARQRVAYEDCRRRGRGWASAIR